MNRARIESSHLEKSGGTHAAADTHGDDHVFLAATLTLTQGMPHHARAAHPVGMADGDGAAIDVEAFVRDAQLVATVDHLYRKGLVQLPDADIVHLQAVRLEQLGNGKHRPDTHFIGFAAGHRDATVDAQGLQAALLGKLALHEHTGRGTVG